MTEFDEILSKALEAARYYHPRLSAEIYVFPKPVDAARPPEPAASQLRERRCRIAMTWVERLLTNGEFDRGGITISQLRCRIFLSERILVPREIILAIAVYKCVEIFVGGHDVWLGKLWDGPVPV
ncbi:hypothetical protein [Bradyrhizobium sp. DASA03007]|uniref:hypothetical protein n=1 Tax=unclassified Bradyrhizobium TaxID=2631580 RepID=UPI003F6F2CC0